MIESTSADYRLFERDLRVRRESLRAVIHAALLATAKREYADLAGQVHDSGDESVADLLRDVELAGRERELQELHDIESALDRIAEGSFGRCIDCDGDIEQERLDVYPTAKRCVACQQRYERNRAGGADMSPSL